MWICMLANVFHLYLRFGGSPILEYNPRPFTRRRYKNGQNFQRIQHFQYSDCFGSGTVQWISSVPHFPSIRRIQIGPNNHRTCRTTFPCATLYFRFIRHWIFGERTPFESDYETIASSCLHSTKGWDRKSWIFDQCAR